MNDADRPRPLGPDSLTWQLGFPRTGLLLAGRSLILQVAHPVVGAGVRDHSEFRNDPWRRLDNTLDSLLTTMFGGAAASTEAQRLRELHRTITGTGFDGHHYSALDPDAYAWVHLSNFDTVRVFNRMFTHALPADQEHLLYREWRQVGRVLGVRADRMPATLAELDEYVADTVTHRLSANETCHEVLDALRLRDVPPPYRHFPAPLWAALRPFGASLTRLTTVGTLPEPLRSRLGQPWTARDEQRLRQLSLAVRTATPLVPDRLLHYPTAYRATRLARRQRRTGGYLRAS